MLKINELIKYYKTPLGSVQALRNIDLEIPRGEIVGLFGENGAGKSTIFKCILNYVRYEGKITLDGEEINSSNIHKLALASCEHSFFPALTPTFFCLNCMDELSTSLRRLSLHERTRIP